LKESELLYNKHMTLYRQAQQREVFLLYCKAVIQGSSFL